MTPKQYFEPIWGSLQKVKWHGDKLEQGSALCPAHDDNTPSLSLGFNNKDGRLLLKCWAGCTNSSICEALGIKPKELFFKGIEPKYEISKIYDYTDELGNILFQKVRYDPKHFLLRRDEKCWSVQGVRRVLYNLKAIVEAKEKYVVVLEGERDVETASWLGYTATTSPESSLWEREYSCILSPYHVRILPHNDAKGLEYASNVAESLAEHGCEDIKIVCLPTKGRGSDLTSFVESSSDSQEIIRSNIDKLIAETGEYAKGNPAYIAIDIRRRMMSIKTDMEQVEALVKEMNRCQKAIKH